jgi:Zn-finger nucleic acid-binding protein
MMFIGNRHCPHCGAAASLATPAQLSVLKCPRCQIDMTAITLGQTAIRECEKCEGLWIEVPAFEKICADREQQAVVLGVALPAPVPKALAGGAPVKVRYCPCPQCGQLMNRVNFARCSGVIVDVCRGHGTWFDRDELREIVEFIRGGGLDLARQKEKHELELEREKLAAQQRVSAPGADVSVSFRSMHFYSDDERADGVSAARDLLKLLLG